MQGASVHGRPRHRLRLRLLTAIAFLLLAVSPAALGQGFAPSHGPAHGYLIIGGGGNFANDIPRLIRMAGGKHANIVVIPTASVTGREAPWELAHFCTNPMTFGGTHCTVLSTTDRAVADSDQFVAPLKTATAVWLSGGRQWRLADAYLGTRTLREIVALLDRGGVVGGGSAGASIQASFLVRGSEHPDDSRIVIAPGHWSAPLG